MKTTQDVAGIVAFNCEKPEYLEEREYDSIRPFFTSMTVDQFNMLRIVVNTHPILQKIGTNGGIHPAFENFESMEGEHSEIVKVIVYGIHDQLVVTFITVDESENESKFIDAYKEVGFDEIEFVDLMGKAFPIVKAKPITNLMSAALRAFSSGYSKDMLVAMNPLKAFSTMIHCEKNPAPLLMAYVVLNYQNRQNPLARLLKNLGM